MEDSRAAGVKRNDWSCESNPPRDTEQATPVTNLAIVSELVSARRETRDRYLPDFYSHGMTSVFFRRFPKMTGLLGMSSDSCGWRYQSSRSI